MKIFKLTGLFLLLLFIYPIDNSYGNGFYALSNSLSVKVVEVEGDKYKNFHTEPERLCVRYRTKSGWSKEYSVEVRTLSGSKLNNVTNSIDYNYYSEYAVIFWGENQASIIELRNYYGSYSVYGTKGRDQNGREWELKKTTYCR